MHNNNHNQPLLAKYKLISTHSLFAVFGTLFIAIWLTILVSQDAFATLTANNPATSTILQAPNPSNPAGQRWETVTIKNGDNLGKIFARLGLDKQQLQAILSLKQANTQLRKLATNKKMQVLVGSNQKLERLSYPLSVTDSLEIKRQGNTYKVTLIHRAPNIKLKTASATIKHSFAGAVAKANLQAKQVNQLKAIFVNKIDFARGVKAGDKFSVLYEAYYTTDNKQVGTGDIVAAEYINQGKKYQAVRFTDPQGRTAYYAPNGTSMEKAFIRNPVQYTYVSSPFSMRRLDPVSNEYHAHRGVDLAAPLGTPIKTSSDGVIAFAGVKNGYGNVVIVQHDSQYKTLYAHMHHIAEGVHSGMHVQAGQLIGYVGRSGMATGSHLHYELFVNNVQQNPFTASLPQTRMLPAQYRAKFIAKAKQLLAQLDATRTDVRLADNEPNTKASNNKQAG